MVALTTPICNVGWPAADFNLVDTKGQYFNLATSKGPNGLLVMFICNHCPYVKAILSKLVSQTKDLLSIGVASVAIMANDVKAYPEDSLENMKELAEKHQFSFPYLYDGTQETAKNYGAVCTPDFFGFNADLTLQYRGRFDSVGMDTDTEGSYPELLMAMQQIAKTGHGPAEQYPSIGCSIKWKA